MTVPPEYIVHRARAEGGIIIHPFNGLEPVTGYAVGGYVPSVVIPLWEFTPERVARFIEAYESTFAERDNYLGVWITGDLVYLEVTTVYTEFARAVQRAQWRNQLYIWDFGAKSEISVHPRYKTSQTG